MDVEAAVAELHVEEFTPADDAEATAILEASLEQLAVAKADEREVSDSATLADMLGEAWEVPVRGTTFFAIPPSIRELQSVFKMMALQANARSAMRADLVSDTAVQIARRLLWVKDGDKLRTARAEELEECFNPRRLEMVVEETLVRNGMELDPKKNPSSPTGPTSSAESASDSLDTPSSG